MTWVDVCGVDDLQADSGVCVLVQGQQIALFYMPAFANDRSKKTGFFTPENAVYAVGNYDPFGKANVLARGLIGDIGGQPVVASPLYKQHFHLQTGVCLEDEAVQIPAYPVQIVDRRVQISM